jgi:D-lactate dehydrogenase
MALKGKTLGIIGTGKIGAHVARIASRGFLMNVIAYDVHPNKELAIEYGFNYVDSLDDIYSQSDVISLHVPLFPSTQHMINSESISKMRDGVTLINTSRGALIHTQDLVQQ